MSRARSLRGLVGNVRFVAGYKTGAAIVLFAAGLWAGLFFARC